MAYVFNVNNAPATGGLAIYILIATLEAAGWVQMAAGDGTSLFRFAPFITSGATGANGIGNNSAWTRIQSPDGVREYTIQRGTVGTAWRIKYSFAGKFTDGAMSATVTPSAADQVIMMGAGSDASPTYATAYMLTDNTYRYEVCADDASPYTFWSASFANGGGTPRAVLLLDKLTGEPTDGDTYLTYSYYSNSTTGLFATSLLAETASASQQCSYATIPAASPTTLIQMPCATYNNGGNVIVPSNVTTNPITTKDELLPIVFMRRSAIASPGYKGIATMMKWPGTLRTTGDTMSVSSASDRIIMGEVSLPWNGSSVKI
jgi:hypothetical protein